MVMGEVRKRVLETTEISEFQRKVYLELLNIPNGTTISYGELGRRIGCRSARAIGQALHRNPFAPDVPCHRVIKSDGSLGGYAFGAEKKAEMLREESSERQDEGRRSEGE